MKKPNNFLLICLCVSFFCFHSHAYAEEETLPWLTPDKPPSVSAPANTHNASPSLPERASVTEDSLTPLSSESIGLISDKKEGSLGNMMWEGTSERLAAYFLSYLPYHPSSPTLQHLRFRLLSTAAVAPARSGLDRNNQDSYHYTELRIKQLSRMKEYDAIHHLVSKLPGHEVTEPIHQVLVASLLYTKHYEKACRHTHTSIKYFTNASWQQLMALCHILHKDWAKAELSISLLRTLPNASPANDTLESWIIDRKHLSPDEVTHIVSIISPDVSIIFPLHTKLSLPNNLPLRIRLLATNWWKQLDRLPQDQKLEALGTFYTLLKAHNHEVPLVSWQYAMMSSSTPPRTIVLHLLENASAHKQQIGKVVALLLFAVGETAIETLDANTFHHITQAMHRVGLHDEAYALTKEFLTSSLPNNTKPFTMPSTIH